MKVNVCKVISQWHYFLLLPILTTINMKKTERTIKIDELLSTLRFFCFRFQFSYMLCFKKNLTALIPGTTVEILYQDSRNIIQLIVKAYNVSFILFNSTVNDQCNAYFKRLYFISYHLCTLHLHFFFKLDSWD